MDETLLAVIIAIIGIVVIGTINRTNDRVRDAKRTHNTSDTSKNLSFNFDKVAK